MIVNLKEQVEQDRNELADEKKVSSLVFGINNLNKRNDDLQQH
jgi:hypothetical protein